MGFLTAVMPFLMRWAGLAFVLAGAAALGYMRGSSSAHEADEIQIANLERDHAQTLQKVAQAGASAAQRTATITAAQAVVSQESDHAAVTQRAALDARIAAGGLRIHTTYAAPGCGAVSAVPGASRQLDAVAGNALPAAAERDPEQVPGGVADTLPADAARAAQEQLELMDWIATQKETADASAPAK